MLKQMVGLHLHFTASVITRVLQSPSLKSTITSLVDTLTCLGLVSISYYSTTFTELIVIAKSGAPNEKILVKYLKNFLDCFRAF